MKATSILLGLGAFVGLLVYRPKTAAASSAPVAPAVGDVVDVTPSSFVSFVGSGTKPAMGADVTALVVRVQSVTDTEITGQTLGFVTAKGRFDQPTQPQTFGLNTLPPIRVLRSGVTKIQKAA